VPRREGIEEGKRRGIGERRKGEGKWRVEDGGRQKRKQQRDVGGTWERKGRRSGDLIFFF
jgi:hypothetical protein